MNKTVREVGEFSLIDRMMRALPSPPSSVVGIGDDCAVLRSGARNLLLSNDMFIEDVHFRLSTLRPADIGWKAASAALSDIAAMGGLPTHGLVAFACPPDTSAALVEDVYQGLGSAFAACGAFIIGGDTATSPDRIVIDVTVMGETTDRRCLYRHGGQPGDLLVLTGLPGLSRAGFDALENGRDAPSLVEAHARPRPRVREGVRLCRERAVHSMTDVSDGLFQDAGHLAKASRTGANISTALLPIDLALAQYCDEYGLDPVEMALAGGEDYELLFTVEPGQADEALEAFRRELGTMATIVGELGDGWEGVRVDGRDHRPDAYEHFAG